MAVYVPWTTPAEMANLLSSLGVEQRIEDSPGPSGLAEQYAKMGTYKVWFYLTKVTTADVLAENDWVRECATIAAAWLLTGHAGEPFNSTMQALWDEVKVDLQLIQSKRADVPGFTPTAPNDMAPTVVNPFVDMQRSPSLRWNPANSTAVGPWPIPRTRGPLGRYYY